jgi:hypothetical protein
VGGGTGKRYKRIDVVGMYEIIFPFSMYENGKMVSVETIPGMGGRG